jgi:two-component system phosphate regulon response regulator PhoB
MVMKVNTLLVVEDEPAIRDMLAFSLEQAGFNLLMAEDTQQARRRLADVRPDLIILDWMLPGESGVEFAKRLKNDEVTADLPVIMLTARSEEDDKIRGLEAGADDYITKPFSPRELIARIKAVLRRASPSAVDENIEFNGLLLDNQAHRVSIHGGTVVVGPTEFRLLSFLMSHPERVYSRNQLLDRVWGNNVYVEERTVDVHIRRLRKVLENTGHDKYVQTVRGVGYRFSKQV